MATRCKDASLHSHGRRAHQGVPCCINHYAMRSHNTQGNRLLYWNLELEGATLQPGFTGESLCCVHSEQRLPRKHVQFLLILLHDTAKITETEHCEFYLFLHNNFSYSSHVSTQKTRRKAYVSPRI